MDYKAFLFEKIIPAVAILVGGFIVIKIIMAALKRGMQKSKHVDNMMLKFVTNAVRIVLTVVLLMITANKLGIDTTSIITMFAAAGAAIALALQGSLSNLASGILIILTKPFSHGDYISGAGAEGTIDSIDLMSTSIITADNKIVNVPNSALTSNSITNFTKSGTRRIDIKIGVSYNSDVEKAKEILKKLAKDSGYFMEDQELSCNILEYADSAIILVLRGWVGAPAYWPATFAINNSIKKAFDEAGIEIPYPQMDIHNK